eukprot:gene1223-1386_t
MGFSEARSCDAIMKAGAKSIDSVLDYLYSQSEEDIIAIEEDKKKKKKKARTIILELQRLFTQLQYLDKRAVSTQDLTMKGFSWRNLDGNVQHDAHELN